MPRIPQEFLDELLSRVDIVELVGSQVPLTRKGRNYWGLCPFHNEKTPSFSVNAEKQIYYCFGCHEGGGPLQFLQKTRHMQFMEAVQELCDRTGMQMPETARDDGQQDLRRQMFDANRDAARLYHSILMGPEGRAGLDYLTRRGVGKNAIVPFGLGFAPDAWNTLERELGKKYPREILTKASLLRTKDGRAYDAFRNRVMFPILNARKQVVAFGGRVMDKSEPKYLNSPETPVFSKSRNLYGLHLLAGQKHIDTLLVTEGYMDVISVRSAGFLPVVASLGTALTVQPAQIIKRYTDSVCLCYDGDSAGQHATWRGMQLLKDAGLKVRIAELPPPMDPDDYARKYGLEGVRDLVDRSLPMTEFQFKVLGRDADLSSPEGRLAYADAVCRQILSAMKSPLELSEYVHRLYTETGIREEDIRAELEQLSRDEEGEKRRTSALSFRPESHAAEDRPVPVSRGLKVAERTILALWVRGKISSQTLEHEGLTEDDVEDETGKALFRFLLEHEAQVWGRPFNSFAQELPEGTESLVVGFLEEDAYGRISQAYFKDCVRSLKAAGLERRREALVRSIGTLPREKKAETLEEIQRIQNEIRSLQDTKS